MDPTPKSCPVCKVPPVIKTDGKLDAPYYVACSNELDCPVWPIAKAAESIPAAIHAWNGEQYI